jgi:uncharacterized membrane protein
VGFDRSARDFWPRIVAAILAVVGIGVTAYLVWERYHGNAPVCALGGGCLTVQRSEWATVAGVPVAIMGLVAYVGMLVCALIPRQVAALGSLFLSLLGVMLSGYLTYLELFSIHAVCEYCVTSAIVVLLLLVVSVVRVMLLDDAGAAPPV